MGGLNAAILPLSSVSDNNEKLRLDSGYFDKQALHSIGLLDGTTTESLGSVASTLRKGIFDIKADTYVEEGEGIPFVRIGDMRDGLIEANSTAWISYEAHAKEVKTRLRFGDIALSKTGYAAASFINLDECNVSQDVVAVKLSKEGLKRFKSGFVVSYLNSKIGLPTMHRFFQGNVQQHLSLDDAKKIELPCLSDKLQERVHKCVLRANELFCVARSRFISAEDTLLEALGLSNWMPPKPLTHITNVNEVIAAERWDSEHFKGKFKEARDQLEKSGAMCFVQLGDLLDYLTNGHTPHRHDLSVGEVPFLTAEHIDDYTVDYQSGKRILTEHHLGELARTALMGGDVLMTIKGRVGNAALVDEEPPTANINQDVALLRFKNNAPPIWYLLSFINSRFGKLEVEKWSTGQINPFLGLYNLRKIEVPLFDKEFMTWVGDQTRVGIQASLTIKQEAQSLLDAAKRAVEIAIEDSEAAALRYLREVEGLIDA